VSGLQWRQTSGMTTIFLPGPRLAA
jgi:hypothetical protein